MSCNFVGQNRLPLFLGTFAVVLTLWGLFVLNATNAERANSSVVRSLLFHLRNSPLASTALGDSVKPDKGQVLDTLWVDGSINMMQGSVDLAFRVKGSKAAGKIYFTSVRRTKASRFEIGQSPLTRSRLSEIQELKDRLIVRWRLIRDDGVVFDLRQELTSRLVPSSSSLPDDPVVSVDLENPDDPFALASIQAAPSAVESLDVSPPKDRTLVP